ncbi:Shikimate kinase I [Methanosarcina barkeri 3]|uniref:Shikimate kinase I n=1 Tax=Methanosarcina barkeri 3 TaxID=1434107 RepID=A0A0E3SK26_METBA|nr:Shikimate kinase I [Methanosarcina barkeri 3]
MPLQTLIDKEGDLAFIRFEEEAILRLEQVDRSVIPPGGSVIYSEKAMTHLKTISKIFFPLHSETLPKGFPTQEKGA